MTQQAPSLTSPLRGQWFSWLDKLATPLQTALQDVVQGSSGPRQAKDWLNGTPVRHRMHPAMVIVPLGAWTTGAVLDLLDALSAEPKYRAGADAAVVLGLVGSVPAALAGLADWMDTFEHQRRVGMAHAGLNSLAVGLYLSSLGMRLAGEKHRGAARALAGLGYGVGALGGALGGELVYTLGVNVPHTVYPKPPADWTDVLASADLPSGKPVVVEVGRVPVLLLRQGGQVFALEEWCPHAGGPLAEGTFEGDTVTCPWHGSCFRLSDGRPLHGPAAVNAPTFEVREEGGRLSVRPAHEAKDWPPPPAAAHGRPQLEPGSGRPA